MSKIIEAGVYLVGHEHPRGMVVEPTEEGRKEAQALKATADEAEALYDLFEDWLGGEWMFVGAEDIGALTEAPIISRDAYIDDDGDVVFVGRRRLYYHSRYAAEDPIAEWAAGRGVFWDMEEVPTSAPEVSKISEDLGLINLHRARLGQGPLDPEAAGWKPEDVAAEAARIRSLNPTKLKRRLLR